MIRFVSYISGTVLFFASYSAFAAGEDPKLKLGLRLGYAVAEGDIVKDVNARKFATGQVPIGVDAGYLVTPHILVGLYGQYGIVQPGEFCLQCTGRDLRFGVQGQYHMLPQAAVDPWFGLGTGYETLTFSNASGDYTVRGFEFLNLQGGADFKLARAMSMGPFLSATLSEYSHEAYANHDGAIGGKALHTWLTLGVRGTLGL